MKRGGADGGGRRVGVRVGGAGVKKWGSGQWSGDVYEGEWRDDKMNGRGEGGERGGD